MKNIVYEYSLKLLLQEENQRDKTNNRKNPDLFIYNPPTFGAFFLKIQESLVLYTSSDFQH